MALDGESKGNTEDERYMSRDASGDELGGEERVVPSYLLALAEEAHLSLAAMVIQRSWRSHAQRRLYALLRSLIKRAELLSAAEVVSAANPAEAKLLSDRSTEWKVRLRLAGERFPPTVVYRVFSAQAFPVQTLRFDRVAVPDAGPCSAAHPAGGIDTPGGLAGGYREHHHNPQEQKQQQQQQRRQRKRQEQPGRHTPKARADDFFEKALNRKGVRVPDRGGGQGPAAVGRQGYMRLLAEEDEKAAYAGGRNNHWRDLLASFSDAVVPVPRGSASQHQHQRPATQASGYRGGAAGTYHLDPAGCGVSPFAAPSATLQPFLALHREIKERSAMGHAAALHRRFLAGHLNHQGAETSRVADVRDGRDDHSGGRGRGYEAGRNHNTGPDDGHPGASLGEAKRKDRREGRFEKPWQRKGRALRGPRAVSKKFHESRAASSLHAAAAQSSVAAAGSEEASRHDRGRRSNDSDGFGPSEDHRVWEVDSGGGCGEMYDGGGSNGSGDGAIMERLHRLRIEEEAMSLSRVRRGVRLTDELRRAPGALVKAEKREVYAELERRAGSGGGGPIFVNPRALDPDHPENRAKEPTRPGHAQAAGHDQIPVLPADTTGDADEDLFEWAQGLSFDQFDAEWEEVARGPTGSGDNGGGIPI